jgi:hypothetical protein
LRTPLRIHWAYLAAEYTPEHGKSECHAKGSKLIVRPLLGLRQQLPQLKRVQILFLMIESVCKKPNTCQIQQCCHYMAAEKGQSERCELYGCLWYLQMNAEGDMRDDAQASIAFAVFARVQSDACSKSSPRALQNVNRQLILHLLCHHALSKRTWCQGLREHVCTMSTAQLKCFMRDAEERTTKRLQRFAQSKLFKRSSSKS